MRRSADTNIWTDKKGQEFKIPDLTDEHLRNILRVIYRANVSKMRAKLRAEAKRLHESGDAEDPCDISDGPSSYDHVMADERLALADGTDREILYHFVPQLPTLEWEAQRRELIKPTGLRR